MTISHELALRALRPLDRADADRLRALSLTNLAAAVGDLGIAAQLIDALPLDERRPGDCAFRHAMRLHARTQDDFHPLGRVHVGAVTLAVALALAERTGPRLLETLSAGYEAMCSVAVVYAGDAQRRGYRPTGIFGPIGAAATAAVALGADRDGIANAIGLAAARSSGTNQSWLAGTDEWLLEIGYAARSGVEAALFAEAGAAAAPDAFEGKAGWARALFDDDGASRLVESLGDSRSFIAGVAAKSYPVSGIAQVPTELGRRARAEANGHELRGAVVRMSPAEHAYPGSANRGPFRSRSDALMSVSFCVACGLVDGEVRLERLDDPNGLADVLALISVVPDPALDETEAALDVDWGSEQRSFEGEGASLLYPTWEALVADADGVAGRSEADPAVVARAAAELASDHPDARRVDTVAGVAA